MTLVAVCSVKGSPGVTTTCVGLGARWPSGEQPVVVVECDPAGGDLLARWRLELSPGLVSLAAAARRTDDPGLVWQHTQRLPGGLPVVAGPPGAAQARVMLSEITAPGTGVLRRAADQEGNVVIADCGRLDPDSPVLPVIQAADVTLLLARARDDALAHVATRLQELKQFSPRLALVLVGDGYPSAEVSKELGIQVWGRLPEDSKGAAALDGRPGSRSAPQRSALGRALAEIALQANSCTRPAVAAETGQGARLLAASASRRWLAPAETTAEAPLTGERDDPG